MAKIKAVTEFADEVRDLPLKFVQGRRCSVPGCERGRYDVFDVCRKHHLEGADKTAGAAGAES